MSTVDRLVLSIEANTDQMRTELQRLGQTIQTFDRNVNQASSSVQRMERRVGGMTAAFRDIVVTLSSVQTLFYSFSFYFGGFVKSIVDANAKFERLNVLLKGLSSATSEVLREEDAKRMKDYIINLSRNAPFALENLTNTFVKLKSGGIDPMTGGMQALVDSVAAFGGTGEQLERAATAVQQMAGKGVISMEELRGQLGEAVPDAAKLMARSMQMSMGDFVKAVSEGKVAAGPALQKMFDEMNRVHRGSAMQMMNTYSGMMERLKTSFQMFALEVNDSNPEGGFFDKMKQEVASLEVFLRTNNGKALAKDVGEALAQIAVGVSDLIKWIYKWREEIQTVAQVMLYWWAGRAVLGTVMSVTRAISGLGGTLVSAAAMWMRFNQGGLAALVTMQNITGSVTLFGRSVGTTNAAMQTTLTRVALLASRFMFWGTVIAGVVAGLVALYRWLDKSTQAQNALNEAKAREKRGAAPTEEEHAKTKLALTQKQKELADLRARAQAYTERSNASESTIRQYNDQIVALENTITATKDLIRVQGERMEADKKMVREGAYNSSVDFATDRKLGQAKATYEQAMQQVDAWRKDMAKSGKSEAEVNKYQSDAISAFNKASHDILMHRIKLEETNYEKYKRNGDQIGMQMVRDKQSQLRTQAEQIIKSNEAQIDLINDHSEDYIAGKGAATDKLKGKRNTYANMLLKKFEVEAALRGESEEFNDNREEWAERAEAIAAGIQSEELLKRAIASTAGEVKNLNNELRAQGIFQELVSDNEAVEGELKAFYENYGDGLLSQWGKDFEAFKRRAYDKLDGKNGTAGTGFDAAARAEADKRVEMERQRIFIQGAEQIRQANERVTDSFLTGEQAREMNYQREVMRVQELLRLHTGSSEEEKRIAADLYTYLENLRKKHELEGNPFKQWAMGYRDVKSDIQDSLVGSLDGFADMLAQGKVSFKGFAKSIISDLAKIIIRAMIAKAILGALGLGGGPVDMSGSAYANGSFDGGAVTALHTGGVVGTGEGSGSKFVPNDIFNFAKKYHTGGIIGGLNSNEVPIIAKKGEGVFTPEQMRALGGMQSPNVTVNVINQSGTPVSAQQGQPRFDGEKMVVDIILKHANQPGPIRDTLRSL